MSPLEIVSLTKTFSAADGPYTAVKNFNAVIEPGEFVSLLGHSGCGKSTILAIIAGLTEATFGGVYIDGRQVREPGLERALAFQSACLLPWLTTEKNVLLAAAQAHPRQSLLEQQAVVSRYLAMLGIADFAKQRPAELSQGTQQRVALARALSLEPSFLLLDEPFGVLDSVTRFDLQDLLLGLWEREPKTVVLVTHDVDEALYLSDRIIVMTDGPESCVGLELQVAIARPRQRRQVTKNPEYFRLRSQIMQFLEEHSRQFAHSYCVSHSRRLSQGI